MAVQRANPRGERGEDPRPGRGRNGDSIGRGALNVDPGSAWAAGVTTLDRTYGREAIYAARSAMASSDRPEACGVIRAEVGPTCSPARYCCRRPAM